MKVAVSVPDRLFKVAENLAGQLKISRSQLYSEALATYLDAHGSALIIAKLDSIYTAKALQLEPGLAQAQTQTVADEVW